MGVVDILLEDAHQEGIEKGRKEGIEKGIEKGLIIFIQNLLNTYPEWDNEKIANITNANVAMVENIRKEYSDKK